MADVRPGYAVLPCSVMDREDLSIFAKMLYAALSSFAGYEEIRPGHKRLAQIVGCSERKVREALDELKANGLVEWKSEATKTGKASIYRIVHPWIGVRQVVPDPGGVRQVVPDGSGTTDRTGAAPGAGEIDKEEISSKESEGKPSTSKRKKSESPIPEDWEPLPRHGVFATGHGLTLPIEAQRFRNNALAKDVRFVLWDRAFDNWLLKASEWKGGNVTPIRKPARRDTPPAPDRESLPW